MQATSTVKNGYWVRSLVWYATVFGIGNLLGLVAIWFGVANAATEAAKAIAKEAATSAVNDIAKSQKVSEQASYQALEVYKSSAETFGRISVLKDMLDDVELNKLKELQVRVNAMQTKLAELAKLLDEKDADKRIQALKAAELFDDNGLVANLNSRFDKIEKSTKLSRAEIKAVLLNLGMTSEVKGNEIVFTESGRLVGFPEKKRQAC